MKNNHKLSELRISKELYDKIIKALEFVNANEAEFELSLSQFRRMAYKSFAESILDEGLTLEFQK